MILPDVNVHLYAHRADVPSHERFRDWLRAALDGDEPVVLADAVLSAFVRVATDHRVFVPPSTLDEAFAFVTDIHAHPNTVPARPGPDLLATFERVCREGGVRGSAVTDAYLAALAIDGGCVLVTADRGFARYRELRWRHPLDA